MEGRERLVVEIRDMSMTNRRDDKEVVFLLLAVIVNLRQNSLGCKGSLKLKKRLICWHRLPGVYPGFLCLPEGGFSPSHAASTSDRVGS